MRRLILTTSHPQVTDMPEFLKKAAPPTSPPVLLFTQMLPLEKLPEVPRGQDSKDHKESSILPAELPLGKGAGVTAPLGKGEPRSEGISEGLPAPALVGEPEGVADGEAGGGAQPPCHPNTCTSSTRNVPPLLEAMLPQIRSVALAAQPRAGGSATLKRDNVEAGMDVLKIVVKEDPFTATSTCV